MRLFTTNSILLWTTIATYKHVSGNNLLCSQMHHTPIECSHGGTCMLGTKKYHSDIFPSYLVNSIPQFNSYSNQDMYCDCDERRTGYGVIRYTGGTCELPYTHCPDGRVCMNGGTCTSIDGSGGYYACDCISPLFHGDSCEFKISCWHETEADTDMYCVNNGVCIVDSA